jgi:ParB-like chromosome segregation protein Spo0J
MTEMIIEQLDIQDIKPYPNNPRKNAKAIDKVADSITQYGFQHSS